MNLYVYYRVKIPPAPIRLSSLNVGIFGQNQSPYRQHWELMCCGVRAANSCTATESLVLAKCPQI